MRLRKGVDMRNLRFIAIVAAAFILLMTSGCSRSVATEIGDTAQDFTLSDTSGRPVSLSNFKGKVIILNFFATWCPPCRSEIPDFVKLQRAYRPQGLLIVGVSTEEMDKLEDFAIKNGVNYPVLVDSGGKVHHVYGPIRAIPTTFIIDKEFKVRQHYIGARPKEAFEKDIKELLK